MSTNGLSRHDFLKAMAGGVVTAIAAAAVAPASTVAARPTKHNENALLAAKTAAQGQGQAQRA